MKKDVLRTSLIAGAIGMVLGAASLQAATQILDASASRPSVRSINIEAQENNRDEGQRAGVVRTTDTQP